MRSRGAAALLVLFMAMSLSAEGPRQADGLRQQVQATDALGALLDQQTAEAEAALAALRQQAGGLGTHGTLPTTRGSRLSYDAAFHAAVQYVQTGGSQAADPVIEQLSEDQLRRELAVLHFHNLGVYLQLNRQLDELEARQEHDREVADAGPSTTRPTTGLARVTTAEEVLRQLREQGGATTRPTRQRPRNSAISALHHPEEAAPQYDAAHQMKASGERAQGTQQPEPSAMTGAQVAAAVMSGASLPGTFGVPSVVAALNARRPGSEPLDTISPSSFPMTSFGQGGMPMPATPPGTPASVVPSPEALQTLSGLLGVTPDQAQTLLREGGSLSQMRAGAKRFSSGAGGSGGVGPGGGTLSTSAAPPSANDARWRSFYYGPLVGENFWTQGSADPFGFTPGGGTYQRSDPRVNQDFDLRLNGDLDRRINSGSDRRLNVHVDPRVNY